MTKFTMEQAIAITAFTGRLACPFDKFQADVEKRLGHSVWTHQFGDKDFADMLKELYRDDFIAMVPD